MTSFSGRLFRHSVPAGFPSPADSELQTQLDLNVYLIRNKVATFFFRVRGDSMKNAGIQDDDVLVVDRSIQARHGHIILAVMDGQYTVKRLYQRNGVIQLCPDNPAYAAIPLAGESQLEVWGVVVAAVSKFVP